MSKHTPGPWAAFYKFKYDEWHVSLPMSEGQMKLALCPDGIQSENREADARLIAAAPDLLSALKEIAAIGEGSPDNIHESQIQRYSAGAIKIARDAVAKAEGCA